MKLGQVANQQFVLALGELSRMSLPAAVSYQVSKAVSRVEAESKEFYRLRTQAIEKYALKDDSGAIKTMEVNGQARIDYGTPEALKDATNEINSLAEMEVEVPKISLKSLLAVSTLHLTAQQMSALEPVFNDDL